VATSPAGQDEKNKVFPYEDFIKNLRISYESDYDIKIQEPGKKSISYDHGLLGFRDTKIEWRTLLDILKDPDHAYRIKSNAERKRLKRISAKIVKFLNKHFPVTIPEGYKLYELYRDKKPGTYRFKFKVNSDLKEIIASSDEALSRDQLLDMIEKYHNKLKISDDEDKRSILDKIDNLMKIAKQKGISENEILYRIKEDEEDIRYDPHENEKPEPKGR